MKIETLLPLGKLDPGLRASAAALDIATVGEDARLAEQLGYDGVITEETKVDPYIVMALAAQATSRVSLATRSRSRFRAARRSPRTAPGPCKSCRAAVSSSGSVRK